jgi:hypothetical protein
MFAADHTRVGVNMGDHAQDITNAIEVNRMTTLGELEDLLQRRHRFAGRLNEAAYDDFIILRLVRPIREEEPL